MLKTMFQLRPNVLKSQSEEDLQRSPPKHLDVSPSSSPFEWITKRRASSLHLDHSNDSSLASTPTKMSPVKSMVNLIEDFKKDFELALRARDVFILQENNGFSMLQVISLSLCVFLQIFCVQNVFFFL